MADYVIPDGWHTPKLKLERISGYFPVEDYGLPYDAQALLRSESMDTYLIMCGGEYYSYNDISDFVTRIVEPQGLPNIIAELRENGSKCWSLFLRVHASNLIGSGVDINSGGMHPCLLFAQLTGIFRRLWPLHA